MNLTFYYDPFSQATSKCKTPIFLKFCKKKRGGSCGLLPPYVYRDLSCPHRCQLLSSPLSLASSLSFFPSQSHKGNPPTSFLFSGTRIVAHASPEPAHPQGAHATLQISRSLDLRVQVLGNPRRNKERESHWLVFIDEQEYLDETNDAASHRRSRQAPMHPLSNFLSLGR